MDTLIELIKKGVSNPYRIPGYIKWKTGVDPWGKRGPIIKAREMRYKYANYPHQTTPIWEEEWDLLIILDACRPDWMKEIEEEYNFISDINTKHSVGSHSSEWISETFSDEYSQLLKDTLYVTGNHYASQIDESNLRKLVMAQDYGEWAYDSASPPANVVTDLAVQAARSTDWERCIVHYMQPHKPFIKRKESREEFLVKQDSLGYEPYIRHFNGEISEEELRLEFISNLKYVLEEVKLLLENIDAPKVVISSDHGQALGEDGLWDHTMRVKHPSMKQVPWIETSAVDEQTLSPDEYSLAEYDEETVKENLEMLGYR
ncbi:hypothetical protein [Halarchaeum sp. P4]|uniref:hypothetical protein n=1 Tax=Halarchaeum sp. P4 TaxID=3421639 RepID=UPI003EBC561E